MMYFFSSFLLFCFSNTSTSRASSYWRKIKATIYHRWGIHPRWKTRMIWQTWVIWTSPQVPFPFSFFLPTLCSDNWHLGTISPQYDQDPLFAAQHLHLFRYRPDRHQPFRPCATLRARYHTAILGPPAWWTRTPFVCYRRRCLPLHDPGGYQPNHCRFRRKVENRA